HRPDADRHRSPVAAQSPGAGQPRARGISESREAVMELIVALGIGALAGSGVWLILRTRTFQVIVGLSLLSYAVNLFIVAMGRLQTNAAPVLMSRAAGNPSDFS